jgi:hypothetical protein
MSMTSFPRSPAPHDRKHAKRQARVLALTSMLTLAGAGCGAVHAAGPTRVAAASSTAPGPSRPGPSDLSPKQRAAADAAGILAAFAVPPGATRLTQAPSAGGGVLKNPPQTPGDSALIDKVAWYRAPGTPQAVLAWESHHAPKPFTRTGSGGTNSRYDMYALPAVTRVLDSRGMLVTVIPAGANTTDVRVDAQVTWVPARAAASMIPSGDVHAVTLTLIPAPDGHGKPPKPANVTATAKVAALVKLVNTMQSASPAIYYGCQPIDEGALTVTFAAKAGAHALATAAISLDACEYTALTIGGQHYNLGGPGPDYGHTVAVKAVHAAGLAWKIPGY